MELIEAAQGDKPEQYRLAEMSEAESREPSGVLDDNGREMNNADFVRMWGADVLNMYAVSTSSNGLRSDEAKAQATAISRDTSLTPEQRADMQPVVFIGRRITDEQRAKLAKRYPHLEQ